MAHMNDLSIAMSERITNPHYGDGCYRRRIQLEQQPGALSGSLEDDCHGFRVRITHDDKIVTGVEADTLRIPLSSCPGAVEPLQQFQTGFCLLPNHLSPTRLFLQLPHLDT